MHLHTRNVNTAFQELVRGIHTAESYSQNTGRTWCRPMSDWGSVTERSSRNGPVVMIDEPVTITYEKPCERVLFNSARDANPFFHLYEALWMLAGRQDIAPLAYYSSKYPEFVQDGDNPAANGAYGYRWRKANKKVVEKWNGEEWQSPDVFYTDQLQILINHLKAKPDSRRAVLQMWNVEDDLLKIGHSPTYCDGPHQKDNCPHCVGADSGSKDVCCNLSVMFSLRKRHYLTDEAEYILDMTVTNRSNDMILGTLGANYVHFTVLQEYMAEQLGAEVGVYNQFSNNLHVYLNNWEPVKWLECERGETQRQYHADIKHVPLVKDAKTFDDELPKFVEYWSHPDKLDEPFKVWQEPFLETVAAPMFTAFMEHKRRCATTMEWVNRIAADDWRIAATTWLEKRMKSYGREPTTSRR